MDEIRLKIQSTNEAHVLYCDRPPPGEQAPHCAPIYGTPTFHSAESKCFKRTNQDDNTITEYQLFVSERPCDCFECIKENDDNCPYKETVRKQQEHWVKEHKKGDKVARSKDDIVSLTPVEWLKVEASIEEVLGRRRITKKIMKDCLKTRDISIPIGRSKDHFGIALLKVVAADEATAAPGAAVTNAIVEVLIIDDSDDEDDECVEISDDEED